MATTTPLTSGSGHEGGAAISGSTVVWHVFDLIGNDMEIIIWEDGVSTRITTNSTDDTHPTDSVFSVGTDTGTNELGNEYVAYLFASVPGFSQQYTYYGTGVAAAPVILMDFTPAWDIRKIELGNNQAAPVIDNARHPGPTSKAYSVTSANAIETDGYEMLDFAANGQHLLTFDGKFNLANWHYHGFAIADHSDLLRVVD